VATWSPTSLFNRRARASLSPKDASASSYIEAYNNRGLSYEVLGRRTDAIADFRKAQSIDSADRISKQQLRVLDFWPVSVLDL